MKTFSAKPLEVTREWYVVDATDKIVGHLAAEIAARLRGKHKPEYTPHLPVCVASTSLNTRRTLIRAILSL